MFRIMRLWTIRFITLLKFPYIYLTTINNANLNLCSGESKIDGFIGIDIHKSADIRIDISFCKLPFRSNSIKSIICISAINYFTHDRAKIIIAEAFRILKPNGILRISSQDLELFAKNYLEKNEFFFNQQLDGKDRFDGDTLTDKFVNFFYGHHSNGEVCKYFYDFESLSAMVRASGFKDVKKMKFHESRIPNIANIDNRSDQVFFLEAVK